MVKILLDLNDEQNKIASVYKIDKKLKTKKDAIEQMISGYDSLNNNDPLNSNPLNSNPFTWTPEKEKQKLLREIEENEILNEVYEEM